MSGEVRCAVLKRTLLSERRLRQESAAEGLPQPRPGQGCVPGVLQNHPVAGAAFLGASAWQPGPGRSQLKEPQRSCGVDLCPLAPHEAVPVDLSLHPAALFDCSLSFAGEWEPTLPWTWSMTKRRSAGGRLSSSLGQGLSLPSPFLSCCP